MNSLVLNRKCNELKRAYVDSVDSEAGWGLHYAQAIGVGIEHVRQMIIEELQREIDQQTQIGA